MSEITIVDYGAGNPRSIANMLRQLGHFATITGDPKALADASHLILPGVGKFDYAMARLNESGLSEALDERVRAGVPLLGICLGAQLLTRRSDEGELAGFGWIAGETVAFDRSRLSADLKVPHIGWSDTAFRPGARLEAANARFYYVHSFHMVCDRREDVLCVANHGYEFVSGIERDNVVGVQFHPEKSHRFGLALIGGFVSRYA
jgi:glutamine amidotransferase